MPTGDPGAAIRYLGNQIGEMRSRYKNAELEKEYREEKKKKEQEEQNEEFAAKAQALRDKKERQITADKISKEMGNDMYGRMYMEDQGALIQRIYKAKQEGSKPKELTVGERYQKAKSMSEKGAIVARTIINDHLKTKFLPAMKSKDEGERMKAKKAYADLYKKVETKNKVRGMNVAQEFAEMVDNSIATEINSAGDEMMKRLDPKRLFKLESMTRAMLIGHHGMDEATVSEMDDMGDHLGIGVDLSGIPSNGDVSNFLFGTVFTEMNIKPSGSGEDGEAAKGEKVMRLGIYEDLLNTTNVKELVEASKDLDGYTPDERMLAGVLAKKYTSLEILHGKAAGKIKRMGSEGTEEIMKFKGDSPAMDRLKQAASRQWKNQNADAILGEKLDKEDSVMRGGKI